MTGLNYCRRTWAGVTSGLASPGVGVLDGLHVLSEPKGIPRSCSTLRRQPITCRRSGTSEGDVAVKEQELTERSEPRWEAAAQGSQKAQVGG